MDYDTQNSNERVLEMCNIQEDVMDRGCSTEKTEKEYVQNWRERILVCK
jgi:hypothetical protein